MPLRKPSPAILNPIVEGLSPQQKRAVLTDSLYSRIVASACAGKIETLTRRPVYLLACGCEPETIVGFTFTEKAAASIKERSYKRVRDISIPAPAAF